MPMLLPPQPAFLGRRGSASRDASVSSASLASSSACGGEGSSSPASSSRGRCDEGAAAFAGRPARRNASAGTAGAGAGNGGLKAFGRRLFQRSADARSPDAPAARSAAMAPRSDSSSGSCTSADSERLGPATPTTPPRLDFPLGGGKSLFGDSFALAADTSSPLALQSFGSSMLAGMYGSSGDESLMSSPPSSCGVLTPPAAAAAKAPFGSSRHAPFVTSRVSSARRGSNGPPSPKEMGVFASGADSDFLRAVLDLSFSEDEYQVADVPSYGSFRPSPSYIRPGLFRNDPRDADDDSEDEYGVEGDECASGYASAMSGTPPLSPEASPRFAGNMALPVSAHPSTFTRYKGAARRGSAADIEAEDDEAAAAPRRPSVPAVGLDTGSKRALYTCTLLKVHPQLAAFFKASQEGAQLIPGAAAVMEAPPPAELRSPRSVNAAAVLRAHPSTLAYTRDLGVAVARSSVMRKLRRETLPMAQEVELGWFQRKYGSEVISPEAVAAGLAQRPAVSPEALARPPMGVPVAPLPASPLSRSLSSADALAAGARADSPTPETALPTAAQAGESGMSLWARRPTYLERTLLISAEESHEPGAIVYAESEAVLAVGKRTSLLPAPRRRRIVKPAPLVFSPRLRELAGLPPAEPLVRSSPDKFRKRERRRPDISELLQSEQPGASRSAAASPARPVREEQPRKSSGRAPPPWIAPRPAHAKRSSTLPASASQVHLAAASPPVLQASPSVSRLAVASPSPSRSLSRASSAADLTLPGQSWPHARRSSRMPAAVREESDASDEEDVPLAKLRAQQQERSAGGGMLRGSRSQSHLAQPPSSSHRQAVPPVPSMPRSLSRAAAAPATAGAAGLMPSPSFARSPIARSSSTAQLAGAGDARLSSRPSVSARLHSGSAPPRSPSMLSPAAGSSSRDARLRSSPIRQGNMHDPSSRSAMPRSASLLPPPPLPSSPEGGRHASPRASPRMPSAVSMASMHPATYAPLPLQYGAAPAQQVLPQHAVPRQSSRPSHPAYPHHAPALVNLSPIPLPRSATMRAANW